MYILSLVKSLRPHRREHWMMLSVLIYSLVGVLRFYVSPVVCNFLSLLSGLMFICTFFKYASGFHLKGTTGFMYAVLILWSLCLTFHMIFIADLRGALGEYKGVSTYVLAFFCSVMFLPNLVPFMILSFPRNYQFDFRYLWRVMWLMCIMYLCYFPFAFWNMTHYSWSFEETLGWGDKGSYGDFVTNSTKGIASLLPIVIMVYLKKYLPQKKWRCFLATYVGNILIAAFMARRGGLAMSVLYLVLAGMMYSLNDKRTSKIKMILMAVMVVGIVFVLFANLSDSFFSTLIERGNVDSRSGVEESFYSDMKSQTDWILGRGWFGQYYEALTGYYRSAIETGFLALILRGGCLYLVPYVSCLLLSFYNGYFKSNNLFCKSFALLCLMQFLSLYPYGWPAFNFFHFIIWLGVWICNNCRIRQMTDQQISFLYFN